MSGSIARSVNQFKTDLQAMVDPELIIKLCQAAGHVWRDRTLGPVQTIGLFIKQILHGNTSCAHVRQLGNFAFTKGAYCEARQRLPVQVLRDLLRATAQRVTAHASEVGDWHGHRVVGVDGSTFSMSDAKELRALFPWAPEKRGFELPVSKFVALFDLITGALLDLAPASMRDHELWIVQRLHDLLRPGDIVVADRLYCTYAYMAQLVSQGLHVAMRVPAGSRCVDFRPHRRHAAHKHWKGPQSIWISRLGKHDQIVEWIKPAEAPPWLARAVWERLPQTLRVRELRYRMDVLRCQSVDGIHRELAVFGIVYNAVRLVMIHSAQIQGVPPDRLSFIDVLRWLALGCPGDQWPTFQINARRCRSPAPRIVRRRHKNHTYMTRPRRPQRKLLTPLELSLN